MAAALRAIVGSVPSDALIDDLLRSAGGDVNKAADFWFTSSAEHRASPSPPPVSTVQGLVPDGGRTVGVLLHTYRFSPGPIGLGLADSSEGVVVCDITPRSQAAQAGVPLLSVLIAIDSIMVHGQSHRSIMHHFTARSQQPIALRLRHPSNAPPPATQATPASPSVRDRRSSLPLRTVARVDRNGSERTRLLGADMPLVPDGTAQTRPLRRSASWGFRSSRRQSAQSTSDGDPGVGVRTGRGRSLAHGVPSPDPFPIPLTAATVSAALVASTSPQHRCSGRASSPRRG
jgi:hypothetical protein